MIKRKRSYSSLDLSGSDTIVVDDSLICPPPLESEFGLPSQEESDSDDSDIELSLSELYDQSDA